jgi:hypothetical protein
MIGGAIIALAGLFIMNHARSPDEGNIGFLTFAIGAGVLIIGMTVAAIGMGGAQP